MRNIKITIQYDGRNYNGSQIQPKVNTIQNEIEVALTTLLRKKTDITLAGRTDSGVHAYGQVANFSTDTPIPTSRIKRALNNLLPNDIYVLDVTEVSVDFHARFSKSNKTYIYKIFISDEKNIFSNFYYYNIHEYLNVEEMKKASLHLIGSHDFKSFMSSGSNAFTTVRDIYSITIKENLVEKDFSSILCDSGKIVTIEVQGNGFLYNMVRIIAGTLIEVGLGKIDSSKIPVIIDGHDRKLAGHIAPPNGLYLKEILYTEEKY